MKPSALIACIILSMVYQIAAAAIDIERQEQLVHLLKHDCGSCHGMTLKGGLGPSLLSESIGQKSTSFLVHTILHGRSGTAMPPWKELLTEKEVHWMVQLLKKGSDDAN